MAEILFISGIDTDAGKSYATGFLARHMMGAGKRVATQKFIQTGCDAYSEDIDLHRRLMGIGQLPEDIDHTTAPIVFSYPASAQLAAAIDGQEIDTSLIDESTRRLAERSDVVLIEGAGGLMVPLTDDFLTIDYIASRSLPVVLVTNGRLGSINHTILSLEAIKARGIRLHSVVYNKYFDKDPVIAADTRGFIERYIRRHFPEAEIIDLPEIN
ncbi:MAG: ATP-dependent dethiobiotin synthetase BioD [Barnesiella sp.]|nr:ATP-dependent dethiobiotin synthetase BioD [Barnesiella sp.]